MAEQPADKFHGGDVVELRGEGRGAFFVVAEVVSHGSPARYGLTDCRGRSAGIHDGSKLTAVPASEAHLRVAQLLLEAKTLSEALARSSECPP